ncbi:hypothetical protein CPB85DRAFT_1375741 [Mucidula mucida]|nr:hypothetical protein CPB85DRAFT_1375741 [Mucidula mucida]
MRPILEALAREGLKKSRQKKDYRSELLFASLINFYRWMPRMGHLRASVWIARTGVGVKPQLLRKHVNKMLLLLLNLQKKTISVKQAWRWLYNLGYRRKKYSKGVYWDGHERKDVKKRRVEYIAELTGIKRFMSVYDGPDMAETKPTLKDGKKEHVIVVHNETAYHANNYQNQSYYLKAGEQVLKKKERGCLIMTSGFLCQRHGNLALPPDMVEANAKMGTEERLKKTDARVTICPTSKAGGNSYWKIDQMIKQMHDAIKIAHHLYSNTIIHWIFNNFSCHGSLAKNALSAQKLNIGPGGKNMPHMHNTVIPMDNPFGKGGQTQKMQFNDILPNDHPFKKYKGQLKGLCVLAEERGYMLNNKGKHLIGECADCKHKKSCKPHLDNLTEEELRRIKGDNENDSDKEEERAVDCCLKRLILMQADFQNQKSMLQIIVKEVGDVCHFLLKFHPELNPIEYYWGWTKYYFQEPSTGNFAHAQSLYLQMYKLGATGVLAEFAVKKFKSHCSVMAKDLEVAQAEWEEKQAKLTRRGA